MYEYDTPILNISLSAITDKRASIMFGQFLRKPQVFKHVCEDVSARSSSQ